MQRLIIKKRNWAGVLLFLAVALFPHVAFAVIAPTNFSEFVDILLELIGFIFPVLATLALLAFIWGLAKFIGSAGNEDAIKDGKNKMIWGLISLFVMVSIWGIVSFLNGSFFGGVFGIPQLPIDP